MLQTDGMKKNVKRSVWIVSAALVIAGASWMELFVQKKHYLIGGGINRVFLFLLINTHILLTCFLLYLIVRHSIKLFMERRRGVPGSTFTRNLVLCFMLFSVLPATFIMGMAGTVIIKSINQWFQVRLDSAFVNAQVLHTYHTEPQRLSLAVLGEHIAAKRPEWQEEARKGGISVYLVKDVHDQRWLMPEVAKWRIFRELNDRSTKSLRKRFLTLLERYKAGHAFDFFGSLYWTRSTPEGWIVLVHRYPLRIRQALIASENALYDYRMLKLLRGSVILSYLFSFALLVLFIVFLSLWAAFYLARGITKPLAQLMQATERIKAGDLTVRVPVLPKSDLEGLATAFNQMTQALVGAQERLEQEQKLKTWQEAAKQMAHEIKNPLTPIQLATERLQRKFAERLGNDPVFEDCTATIIDQVTTIKTLVNHFVQFASLPMLKLADEDLVTIVEEVLKLYRLSYPHIAFTVSGQQLPPIRTDKAKIKLALVNLLDNSVRAMQEAHTALPAVHIVLLYDPIAQLFKMRIQDTGPGIASEVRDRIFLPHVSTSKKNLGLGLAIVHQIFKQLDGSIKLVDVPRGAMFECCLPCVLTNT